MTRIENKLTDLLNSLSLDGYNIIADIRSNKLRESITLYEDDNFILTLTERLRNYSVEIRKIAETFRNQEEKNMGYNFCLVEVFPAIKDYVDIIYLGNKDIRLANVSPNVANEFNDVAEALKGLIEVLKRIYEAKTNESVTIDYNSNKIKVLKN